MIILQINLVDDLKIRIFLNLSYFISKRISVKDKNSFSGTIHNIAIASIAIGLAIMIVSFLILKGFQHNIEEKIISFGGHMQVTKFTLSQSYEEDPVSKNIPLLHDASRFPYIKHIQEYANKVGMLKANNEVMGIVLKGVSNTFDTVNFLPNVIKGNYPDLSTQKISNEVMISQNVADKLNLEVGSKPLLYFIQNPPRVRKVSVSGIYETGMEDFDEKIILGDIRLVQRINNWPDSLVGGLEVFVDNFDHIDQYAEDMDGEVGYDLYIEKISDRYAEIFDWLSLLNRNVVIFLTLTLFVACFNMISILLILIMERTHMIGVFKALGAMNRMIRRIFVFSGMRLIAMGLIIGDIIGIAFGFVQSKFQLIPLDPKNYYMDAVPIEWNWQLIILLNVLTFVLVSLVLVVPTMIISRISPIRSIRFD